MFAQVVDLQWSADACAPVGTVAQRSTQCSEEAKHPQILRRPCYIML